MTLEEPERLVVPVAKGTLTRFFVTSLLGIASCLLMLTVNRGHPTALHSVMRVIGAVGIVFCALTALYAARRLFDPTPGLVLDAEGLADHSNYIAAGRVRWDEIKEIRVTRAAGQRFLTVMVDDPRKFIERGSFLRRKVAEANFRKAGSPINVTARTLRIPFDELVAKTSAFYQRYGKPR